MAVILWCGHVNPYLPSGFRVFVVGFAEPFCFHPFVLPLVPDLCDIPDVGMAPIWPSSLFSPFPCWSRSVIFHRASCFFMLLVLTAASEQVIFISDP